MVDFASWDPASSAREQVGEGEGWQSYVLDPMDLFGRRAKNTRENVRDILTQSAKEGIAAQEAMQAQIEELYKPYYEAATGTALPELSAMAIGGETKYKPSALYEYQKGIGERNINRSMASRGLSKSSAAEMKKAQFGADLLSEDIERYYGGNLSQLQMGSRAADAISAAGSSASGNVGSLYSNLGSNLNSIYQNYGAQRQASFQSASNTLQNMGTYYGSK